MMLYIRMALYLVSGLLAGQGLAIFDADAGTLTLKIEDLAVALSGLAAFAGTFLASRVAKVRGGKT